MNRLAESQTQVTTGRRVNSPSDDPAAGGEIIRLMTRLSRLEQYQRNVKSGLSQLSMTETTLEQVRELAIRIKSLAVQGANDATTAQGRRAIAEQIDQELRQLVSLANTRYGGRCLFGGSEIRQAPYEAVEGGEGWLEAVNPTSPNRQSSFELIFDEGERVKVTLTADDVFTLDENDSLFGLLFNLRQALTDNNGQAVGDLLPRLDEALEKLNGASALVGARINSAQNKMDLFDRNEITLTDRLSDIGDVDLADAMTRLNENMVAYELALRASANVIQMSLVNFITA